MAERSVLLRAVGDIALGDHPLSAGCGAHSSFRSRYLDYPFEHVAPLLSSSDIGFGNLECALSERGLRPWDHRSMQMRGQPSYATALRNAGFLVLNVANNHSMQHGAETFLETVRILRDARIAVCGLAGSSPRTALPCAIIRNDLKVAFLGWSLRPRQYFASDPLYAEGDREGILRDVRQARQIHDCVVVSLHWGDEFIERPAPAEIALAHDIMDAGADLIVGHHPHVVRGVERWGRGWIVYSLGNFLADTIWSQRLRESAVAECRLTAAGVESVELLPVRMDDDYRPVLLEGDAAARARQRLAALSQDVARLSAEPASQEAFDHYRADADRALAQERWRSRIFYFSRIRRRPFRMMLQQVSTFVRSRLARRS